MNFWNYNKKIGIDLNKNLGNTNTASEISDILVGFINFENVNKDSKFIEPAVGAGSFYFSILKVLLDKGYDINYILENMIYAFDIDENALKILKTKLLKEFGYSVNKNTKIFNENFLTFDFKNFKFDYIITNPPYISNKNIKFDENKYNSKDNYISEIRNGIDKRIMNVSDIYVYFYIKSLKILKEKGKSIFLCSDSWIDSKFGEIIKNYILSKDYNLDLVINSQLYPFFRDDTNAILTVISKNENNNFTRIINIRDELKNVDFSNICSYEISKEELKLLFDDNDILNKRNSLILFYEHYFEINNFFLLNNKKFIEMEKEFYIENTSLSQSKMLSSGLLAENHLEGDCKLFWQNQARVNKVPNYKLKINENELKYSVLIDKIEKKFYRNIKEESIYLSSIIDRFPLFFYTEYTTFHISKYFSILSKDDNKIMSEELFRLNSIYTILNMELKLKEGTRKTLRKGECGLAKEIKKSDLEKIIIPKNINFNLVKNNMDSYSNKIIYNIENALLDEDYIKIQKHITKELGLSLSDLEFAIENVLFLYLLRMRNIKKIKNFNSYYKEIKEKNKNIIFN